ncbi:hypothetical protein PIIN_05990 [Serendipita indica DSM 11827]|uniref:DUF7721 domain-containing protein n=1 Tax=Serendipita indica (strain DSM 11827) TaxID=1109443 RepID=G4TL62_SERID|nr:hypothetical protein PIIN_05990 [Serendipita indica DSM 11827]
MDNFISMAQKGYAAYTASQGHQTPQTEQYQGDQSQQQSQGTLPVDHHQATQIANSSSGSSGNSELFSQAMAFLSGGTHSTPVNETHVTDAHKEVYDKGNGSNVDASSIGSAAALQVLKSFMSSQGNNSDGSTAHSGGDFQTKMIGMAMSEAATMFDKTGNSGDKQDAVNGAAATMFKLLVQSKLSGSGQGSDLTSLMGGSNSGGLGQLLNMASQFTK